MYPEILFVVKNPNQLNFEAAEEVEDVINCDEGTMVATYQLLHIKKYASQVVCID